MNVPSHMMEPMTEPVNRFRHNRNVFLQTIVFFVIWGVLMGFVLLLGYHWSINTSTSMLSLKLIHAGLCG